MSDTREAAIAPEVSPSQRLEWVDGPLRNRSRQAAFLCYHSVADGGPPFISLAPGLFERHLRELRRRGYVAGGRDALFALAEGRPAAARQVFLTFDDGYRDNFTNAFPLLREHGFTATIFLIPPLVDEGAPLEWPELLAQSDPGTQRLRSLDWAMVERMAEGGIEFGSHSQTHRRLPTLSDEELQQELLDSRTRIKERLGRCDSIAYPFGAWDARVTAAAAAAGYSFGFTSPSSHQMTASRMSIPRIDMDHRDSLRRFSIKLSAPGRTLLLSPAKTLLRKALPAHAVGLGYPYEVTPW